MEAGQCLLLTLSGHAMPKLHSGARACRRGSLEIIIKPENGLLSSKIRKIAHDADSAKSDRQVKTVTFKSENRLKLANMMTIQRTKMARNGVGMTRSGDLQVAVEIVRRRTSTQH